MSTIKITRATRNHFPKHIHPHLEYMAASYRQALRDTLSVIRNLPERDADYVDAVAASLEVETPWILLSGEFVKKHSDLFVGEGK